MCGLSHRGDHGCRQGDIQGECWVEHKISNLSLIGSRQKQFACV